MAATFQWITLAASTSHPAVVFLLKQVGLDIGRRRGARKNEEAQTRRRQKVFAALFTSGLLFTT